MKEPAYPAARLVAARLEKEFARHRAASGVRPDVGPQPEAAAMEAVIDAAFWASLRQEEGYPPKISIVLLPPERAGRPLTLERPLPLGPEVLTRLAPAVENPGIHLGVWRGERGLSVWGTTHSIPDLCFVVEVASPGLLVVKHPLRGESGKFLNVAVLEGERIKIVDEQADRMARGSSLFSCLLGSECPVDDGSPDVLLLLAVSMRAHRRGGSLLVVPDGDASWTGSIKRPVPYAVSPPLDELGELARQEPSARVEPGWPDALPRAVDAVAGLTAVDGATLVTRSYRLLAFGATIHRREGWAEAERVLLSEPVEGAASSVVHPVELGGTRHTSAAQFVHDQREAAALVASQDGRFTVLAWSPSHEMVHAHRVEALLM